MAGEWRSLTATEFCASVRDGTHDSPKPVEYGRFLVTSRHITGGQLDLSNAYKISQDDFDAVNIRSKVDRWDVLISMIGTVGEPCLIKDEPDFAIKNIGLFKSKGEVEGKWLYYYLRTAEAQHFIREQARGTTQQYIPLEALRKLPIPVPDNHKEMSAIVHILGTLDDKIELNRRMNETLEQMARALFKSWFVDFDPVRAKAAVRRQHPNWTDEQVSRAACPNLNPEIAALFPDSFQDSDLGEIPKGWKVIPLSEVTTLITKGTTPTQTDLNNAPISDEKVNYIRANCIEEDGSILIEKLLNIPLSVHTGILKRSILKSGDILYTIAGTIGRIALVEDWLLPANTNQAIAIIRPVSLVPPKFLILTMRQESFRQNLHSNIVHAVQANLSLGIIAKSKIIVPSIPTLSKLFAPVETILSTIINNRSQSRTLATIRDALLPKLISGEIRVKDAERFLKCRGVS